ncbi:MAG: AbrB/MazE/SpoVT family DNA-binding domain-containing protein [Acidobacteriota bacterium]
MKSRISSKGQITVPCEVREQLGLYAGTPVEFELHEQGVLVRKSVDGEHPVDRLYGRFQFPGTTDEMLRELRGPAPAEPKRARRAPRPRSK